MVLRTQTAGPHAAAEDSFALETRLTSRAAYGALLVLLREFYQPLEAALDALPGWERLTPAVDLRARRRAALIDDDLRELGADVPELRSESPPAPPAPPALPVLDSLGRPWAACMSWRDPRSVVGWWPARRAPRSGTTCR